MLNGSESIADLRTLTHVRVFLDYEDLTKRDLILAVGFDHLAPPMRCANMNVAA